MPKIGVFDSGVGGLSVVEAIKKAFPAADVIFKNDTQHVPYGSKPPAEIYSYVLPILNTLSNDGCDVIVVACNTVSTTLIDQLRAALPKTPLVAMEPMVKPAAGQTKSQVIAVCATPTTLASDRYQWLKAEYAKGVKVLEPDCSQWSAMIEANQVDKQKIAASIDQVCAQGADVIVLGCTHYHWIEDVITAAAAGRATVLQPEQPVIRQLASLLKP